MRCLLFSKVSWLGLEPKKPITQWVLGFLPGVSGRGVMLTTTTYWINNEWNYTSVAPYAGVVRMGTTLPYLLSVITSIMHERNQLLMKLRKRIADVFSPPVTSLSVKKYKHKTLSCIKLRVWSIARWPTICRLQYDVFNIQCIYELFMYF